eukprot:7757051-Pyramimonas_sp.AAC.1
MSLLLVNCDVPELEDLCDEHHVALGAAPDMRVFFGEGMSVRWASLEVDGVGENEPRTYHLYTTP